MQTPRPIRLLPVFCLLAGLIIGSCVDFRTVPATAQDDVVEAESKEFTGRLPNNFRKLGLFYKQKQEIYRVQALYRERIEDLERKLNALEDERDEAVFNVLTDAQKEYFREIVGDGSDPILDAVKRRNDAADSGGTTDAEPEVE